MEKELMILKNHVSTQQRLVKDLMGGIYLKALSDESVDQLISLEPVCTESSPPSKLEIHINDISETLDILLSEHRLDEALDILQMEAEAFEELQLEENFPADVLMSYNSAISEKNTMLAIQLTLVAENPRIGAAELQKALAELCKLGESHLATQLLLKYYNSRLRTGQHNLQHLQPSFHGLYTQELAKFVFSVISQAGKAFVLLFGETSPYASELIQWACDETEVFVGYLNKHVKSISEISGGLSASVEAMQFAVAYCYLLEAQKIVLHPHLIKLIRPCMEEILQTYIDHYKKVISIFTATDTWVLGRYLVSGVLNERCHSLVVGQQLQYCLLTNSGRKFVTLMQAITEDTSPLIALQMEGFILEGLKELFTEYIANLRRAIIAEANTLEKGSMTTMSAVSMPQQVSMLANLSTLLHLFSSIACSIFKGTPLNGFEEQEIASCFLYIRDALDQLKSHFYQQFISKVLIFKDGQELATQICVGSQDDSDVFQDVMPSVAFQVMFSELRQLEKLSQDDLVEVGWLMGMLRELMENIFVWVLNNESFWTILEEDETGQLSNAFDQVILDVQFLLETARSGGYFSDNLMNASLALISKMELAFLNAGANLESRDEKDEEWARNAALEAIRKLEETEKNLQSKEVTICAVEDEHSGQQEGKDNAGTSSVASANDVVADEVDTENASPREFEVIEDDDELDEFVDSRSHDEADDVEADKGTDEALSQVPKSKETELLPIQSTTTLATIEGTQ
ncbi:Exocyst component Exo84, C-terminal [Dillenia turbinata]|uniref:Exocyst component Exo84, C-terminal n=1 Tax=Dillenia turbinata TaxID=194707 RepID=A0AAN8W643_9MAGN